MILPGGLHRSKRRSDAIHAPPIARNDVLRTLDRNAGTKEASKQVQLRRAEPLARVGRGADRAMVLDEEEAAALAPHLGHVALFGAHARQLAQLLAKRRRPRDARAV